MKRKYHINIEMLMLMAFASKTICSLHLRCVKIGVTFQKHAYSNILKILAPKNENFQINKNSDIFLISAQIIDFGYSLELPQ